MTYQRGVWQVIANFAPPILKNPVHVSLKMFSFYMILTCDDIPSILSLNPILLVELRLCPRIMSYKLCANLIPWKSIQCLDNDVWSEIVICVSSVWY